MRKTYPPMTDTNSLNTENWRYKWCFHQEDLPNCLLGYLADLSFDGLACTQVFHDSSFPISIPVQPVPC
jgi:hypothetical protein